MRLLKIAGRDPAGNAKPFSLTDNGEALVRGPYPEYRQLSTDPEPDAATAGKGATIYQIDTGIAKISNGTAWEVL